MKNYTDYELIEKCLNGEKEYFSEIISRYKNLIYSIVLKSINNKEDSNDLSQEIFIKIYKNLDKYSPNFKFSTWITKVSVNHIIDYNRKQKYEIVSIEDMEHKLSLRGNPEENFIEKEELEYINFLIDNLPEIYKTPLILYHKKGLSYQEISDITKEPLSKVKNRIFRGRKMLKDELLKLKDGGSLELRKS